ncbi:hypothetical protein [Chromohalobacter israelensis]|uniref:hypothetical protein n=1 Tax=Chromohalobacter israelensis TaxID=141390 RepID=UPI0005524F5F|nr:hypothetical protein [Chromohalobacter israelensis]MDF9434178.1 metallothionein [Chromohalobacter israelensis]
MAELGICACPGCEEDVTSENAALSEGQAFCCTGCAAGHPEGLPCAHEGCPCTELNRPSSGEPTREGF